jgi:hypothetical protein
MAKRQPPAGACPLIAATTGKGWEYLLQLSQINRRGDTAESPQLQPQVLKRGPKRKETILGVWLIRFDQFVDVKAGAEDSKLAGRQHHGFGVCVLRSSDERFGEVFHKSAVEGVYGCSEGEAGE